MKIEFTITIDEPAKKVVKRRMVKFGTEVFATKESVKKESKEIISKPVAPAPEPEIKVIEVAPEPLSAKTESERHNFLPVFTEQGHRRSTAAVIRNRLDYLEKRMYYGANQELLVSELKEGGCEITLNSFRTQLLRARRRHAAMLQKKQSELSV